MTELEKAASNRAAGDEGRKVAVAKERAGVDVL